MKIRFTLFFLLIFLNNLFFQINATIIDEKTNEKVPFVNIWVENENIGTSADANGKFTLEKLESDKILVFSAIGYENLKINSNEIKEVVKLVPTITNLKEVVLIQRKNNLFLVIEEFKKSKINHFWGCKTPWMVARYFDYKESYNKTQYLKSIKLLTRNDNKQDAIFNLRIYNKGKNGEPENYIFDENIIGIAKKGKKITEIDVSQLYIQIPQKGFFIAVEWIITEINKHEYSYKNSKTNLEVKDFKYSPSFGIIPSDLNDNSWIYIKGSWSRNLNKSINSFDKKYKNKYMLLAMELTLTN